jgi:hypothetical protein
MFYHLFIKLIYSSKLKELRKIKKLKNLKNKKIEIKKYLDLKIKKYMEGNSFRHAYIPKRTDLTLTLYNQVESLLSKYNNFVLEKFKGHPKYRRLDTDYYDNLYNSIRYGKKKEKIKNYWERKKAAMLNKAIVEKSIKKLSLKNIKILKDLKKYLLGEYEGLKSKSLMDSIRHIKDKAEKKKKINEIKIQRSLFNLVLKHNKASDINLNGKLNIPKYKFDDKFKIVNNKMDDSYLNIFMHVCKKYEFQKYRNWVKFSTK